MEMRIETLVVSAYEENTYLVWNSETAEGVVFDPGAEGERIVSRIEELKVDVKAILLTHGHADHIGAVAEVKERYGAPVYIGRGEERLLADPRENLSAFFGEGIVAPPPDYLLDEGDTVEVAGFRFSILSTPGHSPASICYHYQTHLFSGDVLFMGSIGRTDFPHSNHQDLMDSLRDKVLTLPDDTVVYPGHGPTTTIGRERTANPFLTGLSSRLA